LFLLESALLAMVILKRLRDLRDAIIARYQDTVKAREVSNKFNGVPNRKVREGEEAIKVMMQMAKGRSDPNYELMALEAKPEHTKSKFVYRYVSKFVGASIPQRQGYTEWELKEAARLVLSGKATTAAALSMYGIHDRSFRRFVEPLLQKYGVEKPKEIVKAVKSKQISLPTLNHSIDGLNAPAVGRPTILTADEEAMLVAKAEVSAQYSDAHGRKRLTLDVSDAVEKLFPRRDSRNEAAKKMHAKRILRRVNAREPGMKNKSKRSKTGEIKIGGLSHKRAKQSDPRLHWIMVHRIVKMYREAKNNIIAHQNHSAAGMVTPSPTNTPRQLAGDGLVLSGPSNTASACPCDGCKSLTCTAAINDGPPRCAISFSLCTMHVVSFSLHIICFMTRQPQKFLGLSGLCSNYIHREKCHSFFSFFFSLSSVLYVLFGSSCDILITHVVMFQNRRWRLHQALSSHLMYQMKHPTLPT
jgi:hypothetical protein